MAFWGFISHLIINNGSSSNLYGTNTNPARLVQKYLMSKASTHLNSYIAACREDPELKSFDSLLQQRTSKLFNSLSTQGNTEKFSLDPRVEVCGFLLEVCKDLVKMFLESKEDVWKNEELRSLVNHYFDSTTETLNLFNTVENCINKARISQLKIRVAVTQFETESMDTVLGGNKKKKKYSKTLEELNKFKAMGDPFGDEFVTQYESVFKQHTLLLNDLYEQKVKLDKKQQKVKKWKKLSNAVFATTLVSVLVLSLVTAAPHVAVVAAGLAAPIATSGAWFNNILKDCENAVEKQRYSLSQTERRASVNFRAMETIKSLVDALRASISWILDTTEVAFKREEDEFATKSAMQEIIKHVEGFTKQIEEVSKSVAKHREWIVQGRDEVLEHVHNAKEMGK